MNEGRFFFLIYFLFVHDAFLSINTLSSIHVIFIPCMVHVRVCMLADAYHSQVVKSHIKTVVAYKDTAKYRARNNFRVSSHTWLIQLYMSVTDYCMQWAKNRKTVWFCLPYCHQWLPAILNQYWWLLTKHHWNSTWQMSRIWNSLSFSDIMIDGARIDWIVVRCEKLVVVLDSSWQFLL